MIQMLFITSKTLTKLRHNLLDSVGDTNDQESEQEPLPQPRKKSCFHCCVPQCNGDSRYHNELKFHRLPGGEAGKETRKRWLVKIRRDEGPDFKVHCMYLYVRNMLHNISVILKTDRWIVHVSGDSSLMFLPEKIVWFY